MGHMASPGSGAEPQRGPRAEPLVRLVGSKPPQAESLLVYEGQKKVANLSSCLYFAALGMYGVSCVNSENCQPAVQQYLIMVALWNRADHNIFMLLLWSSYVIGQTIIFLSCEFLSSFFFPRLISAAVDWMSTILPHMVWP